MVQANVASQNSVLHPQLILTRQKSIGLTDILIAVCKLLLGYINYKHESIDHIRKIRSLHGGQVQAVNKYRNINIR